jgi:5-methylcytosine-specific restriction protein A
MSAVEIENLLTFPSGDPSATLTGEAPTEDPHTLDERVGRARAVLSLQPGKLSTAIPSGSKAGTRTETTIHRYLRDPEVVAWVLENAGGVCEVCTKPAPFLRGDGFPYLEVHHVRPLAEGGPDTVDNTIAVCPNCHRQLHYGAKGSNLNTIKSAHELAVRWDKLLAAHVVPPQYVGRGVPRDPW